MTEPSNVPSRPDRPVTPTGNDRERWSTSNHTSNGSAWIAKNELGETVFHGEGEHTIPKDEKR